MALTQTVSAVRARLPFDRLGALIALLAVIGIATPFVAFRANRIVPGNAVAFWDALPAWEISIAGVVLLGFLFAAR